MTIEEDSEAILKYLATITQYEGAQAQEIATALGMSPEQLNTAVPILEDNRYAKPYRYAGTAPFDFYSVAITPQGRLALERVERARAAAEAEAQADAEAGQRKLQANVKALRRKVWAGAKDKQRAAPEQKPPPDNLTERYDVLITSQPLQSATRKLFADEHYAEAVEEAYKCVNNSVKKKAGLSASSLDGRKLVERVFSLDRPILKLNSLRTESERNEQSGYMSIFAGCWTGIRSPHAHGHDLKDDPSAALEMLIWANHLMRVVEHTKRARRRPQTGAAAGN